MGYPGPCPGAARLGEPAGEAGYRPVPNKQEAIVFTYRPRPGPHPRTAAGLAAARLRRLAAALAAVTCTLLASAAAIMPAAWAAVNYIPNDSPEQAPADGVVTAGGMPGWQITLIALGAALIAAAAAVLLDRARAARRAASAATT
jgi:hypothetical protein